MKSKKMKISLTVLFAAALVFGVVSGSSALIIDTHNLSPAVTQPVSSPYSAYSWGWVGNQSSNAEIMAIILDPAPALLSGYTELYKVTREGGAEEGALKGSYSGSYADTHTATITYDGGSFVGSPPTAYLFVKDGNAEPNWYLIALTGWDGKETIELYNFYNGEFGGKQGGISHVSLIGGSTSTSLPEPYSLLLLGLGLVGLAGMSRFRK